MHYLIRDYSYRTRLAAEQVMRTLRLDLFVAFRSVLRQRRRNVIGLSTIVFGVTALVLAAGFAEWIFFAMRESTIRARFGHIQIARAGYFDHGSADPFRYLLPEVSRDREAIESMREVEALSPRLSFSGLVSLGDSTLSFIGEGMTPEKEVRFSESVAITAGANLSTDAPNGVILGQGLAENLGAKIGDKVVLLVNTSSGGINAADAQIRGVFSADAKEYDDVAIRVPLALAQKLLRTGGAHVWAVLLKDTAQTDAVVDSIRRGLLEKRLDVTPWYRLADFYNKTVVLFSKQIAVVKLIIAVIIVLSISNTMTMNVMERTWEIGTAMALGDTRATVMRRFIGEGLALGVVGGLLGLLLGWLLAWLISEIGIPMPPPPGMESGYVGRIMVTWSLALDAFFLAALTSVIAAVYPAWKASHLTIVDAVRHSR